MSETDCEDSETEGVRSGMSVVAQGSIEASQTDLDRVLTEFTEDELVVRQPTDTRSGDRGIFEIQAGEGETLSRFHEACGEHGIVFSIERLYRQ